MNARDRLFETAARLFYQHGYRAVGVDLIAAQSGIGKMTLYRHFASKEELVLAFLRASNEDFWGYFERAIRNRPPGVDEMKAFFIALRDYTTSPECLGCPFINVVAEYPDHAHPIHRLALQHKAAVQQRFLSMATQSNVANPAELANALMLLMEGAYVAARMFGPSPESPAHAVGETARVLIDAARNSSATATFWVKE
jgi:AcrR family transcriptional regulator